MEVQARMSTPALEVARRRTFAIISHPDAGKTTLTEKLLLYAGAIHVAGSVKARKASRHATSDWMEIEKQRGISVASSVMQAEYRGCVINLLDTPGHQDFSEDTYRVLTAVDAALMVIDAGKGIEPQTLRLLQVCRARGTPIITFVNKLDREVRPALELLDEIESALGMSAVPLTWPIGMGRDFAGVIDLRAGKIRLFAPGSDRLDRSGDEAIEVDAYDERYRERFGAAYESALSEAELVSSAVAAFERDAFLAARQTPVFFGSAINNFGVKEVLDALVEFAPPPGARAARTESAAFPEVGGEREGRSPSHLASRGASSPSLLRERQVAPGEAKFSGVVFKIQANMDPAHRDRVAFVRVCSGRFERGMRVVNCRTGREVRTSSVVSFLSQRREIVDQAYAGDLIGIPNHGTLRLGDTLTEGEILRFTGLPFFAPELFRRVELTSLMKTKQLRTGLAQLGEEGAIQVFHPCTGGQPILGAVGALQFEVVAHRLEHEYGAAIRFLPVPYVSARWVSCEDPAELKRFIDTNAYRMAYDAAGVPAFFASSLPGLEVAQERSPKISFHALREYTGLAGEASQAALLPSP